MTPPEAREPVDTASMGTPASVPGVESSHGFGPGSRIGDYEIVSAIGEGGMGEVYRVRNVISDRTEAMKVLRPGLTRDPGLSERFIREIKVQAALSHPNIASLHTAFRYNDQIVMILEFVDGVPLDRRLHDGPIPLPDCLAYITQVLRALSYAHEHGVIHRDIKPSNIMLVPDGSIKLMDFGIAQVAADPRLTGTGVTVGSPYYMSPEQIRGGTPDARSDIYALGITLYELVTGRRPIQGDSEYSIMAAHLNDAPMPPISLDHTLPAELNEIILMSIAKQPEQRFQTANAFLNAIESVRAKLGGQPAALAPAPAAPPVAAAAVPAKSHRALYMALGAVAAVMVLAAIGIEAPKWFRTSAHQAPEVTTPVQSQATAPVKKAEPPPAEPAPGPAEAAPAKPTPPSTATAQPVRRPDPKTYAMPRTDARAQATQAQPPREQAQPEAPPAQPVPHAPAVSTADLQNVEDRMSQITARISSLDRSLQRLEQSQNASGLGIRSDWAQARDMMHSFFNQAESAMRNQDAAAATRYLDRAEVQVDKLAKALNQ